MKKVLYLTLVLVFSLTTANVFAQAAAPGKGKAAVEAGKKEVAAGKVSLAELEGLTEEQILALLKTMELDDIMSCLRLSVSSGSRELLVNMLGALNSYMGGLEPQKAMEVAQRAAQENPSLSFGTGKDGKPVVYVTAVNEAMNNLVNTSNTQDVINDEKTVVSKPGSL